MGYPLSFRVYQSVSSFFQQKMSCGGIPHFQTTPNDRIQDIPNVVICNLGLTLSASSPLPQWSMAANSQQFDVQLSCVIVMGI